MPETTIPAPEAPALPATDPVSTEKPFKSGEVVSEPKTPGLGEKSDDKSRGLSRQKPGYDGLKKLYSGETPQKSDGVGVDVAPTVKEEPKTDAPAVPEKVKTENVSPAVPETPPDVEKLVAELEKFEIHGNASEERKSQFKTLKEKGGIIVKALHEKLVAAEKMVAELSGKSKKEMEELQKQLKDTKRFEYAFDVHADPEFQKQYVEPANKVFKEASEILKRAGATESEVAGVNWDNEIAVEEIAQAVETKSGKAAANIFRQKASSLREIRQGYFTELDKARTNYEGIVAEKQKAREEEALKSSGLVESTISEMVNELAPDKKSPRWGFMRDMEPTIGMTKEQVQAVQEHNKMAAGSRERVSQYARVSDPVERTKIAVAAELGVILSQERSFLLQKVEELSSELEKYQKAGSVRRTPGTREVAKEPSSNIPHGGKSISSAFAEKFGGQ